MLRMRVNFIVSIAFFSKLYIKSCIIMKKIENEWGSINMDPPLLTSLLYHVYAETIPLTISN